MVAKHGSAFNRREVATAVRYLERDMKDTLDQFQRIEGPLDNDHFYEVHNAINKLYVALYRARVVARKFS